MVIVVVGVVGAQLGFAGLALLDPLPQIAQRAAQIFVGVFGQLLGDRAAVVLLGKAAGVGRFGWRELLVKPLFNLFYTGFFEIEKTVHPGAAVVAIAVVIVGSG